MRIYLAYAAAGGWTIRSLAASKNNVLASFYYDKKEINENIPRIGIQRDEIKRTRKRTIQ